MAAVNTSDGLSQLTDQSSLRARAYPTYSTCILWGEFLVIDFRLPFGWRNSPGWWAQHAAAVKHAYCNTTLSTAEALPDAPRVAGDVHVVLPPVDQAAQCATRGVQVTPPTSYPTEGNFDAEMFVLVDDMVLSEACERGREYRLRVATQCVVSDHLRMLGASADIPVPVLSAKKLTNWSVAQEILVIYRHASYADQSAC